MLIMAGGRVVRREVLYGFDVVALILSGTFGSSKSFFLKSNDFSNEASATSQQRTARLAVRRQRSECANYGMKEAVPAREGEMQLRGLQPVSPRQAETLLRAVQPLPARRGER